MSTNFYWNPDLIMEAYNIDIVDRDDPKVHIGKLSAAGMYCKTCGITQCGDSHYVHMGGCDDKKTAFLMDIVKLNEDNCPNCNAPWGEANSFTFTMMGHLVTIGNFYNIEIAERNKDPLNPARKIVIDDLGVLYSAAEFLDDVLRTCPIQFQSYGSWS